MLSNEATSIFHYVFLEKRHKNTSGDSSVQHLLTEKPIVKGLSFKSKNKNSPRNSPKLTTNCDTNLLEKYKLPKPPVNRNGGKFAPGTLEQSNSALAKQLRSCGAQPVVALDDVSLTASIANPSSIVAQDDPITSLALTPKSSVTTTSDTASSLSSNRHSISKRSLDSSLTAFSKNEPPKKKKVGSETNSSNKKDVPVLCSEPKPIESTPSPNDNLPKEHSPKPIFSMSETTFINTTEPPKSSPKLHQITTFDKSIPCKGKFSFLCVSTHLL